MKSQLQVTIALVVFLIGPASQVAVLQADESAEAASKLSLVELVIEPQVIAPDTLCRLRVKLRNDGPQIASQLGFSVKINDQELSVYGNQLYMFPIPPGETSELQLYNFWSTETSRPTPASGKLVLEVSLKEAKWMKREIETEAENEVEVWTPLGDVAGLPSQASHTITLASKKD